MNLLAPAAPDRNDVLANPRGERERTGELWRGFATLWPPEPPPVTDLSPETRALALEARIRRGERLAPEDLDGLDGDALWRLRGVVRARHGYRSPPRRAQAHFAARPWYAPRPGLDAGGIDALLTDADRANLALLEAAPSSR